ncbi:MAG: GNAT family N-acetyltransferase [Acidobacteriaceae bacterium]
MNIRLLRPEDADAVLRLSAELGYPADRESMLRRIEQIAGEANRAVLVACLDGQVVGWIDLSLEYHLQIDPVALIGGLVVYETVRNRGIGRELCEAAEDWARGRGVTLMRVRSNVIRERAHAFYLRDGYARVKTSAVFEKAL